MNRPENILIGTRSPTDTSNNLLVYFITFAVGFAFILIQTRWGFTVAESSGDLPGKMPGIIGVNNMQNAIGKALLGIVGGLLLLLPSNKKYHFRPVPLIFFSGYLFFCFSSILWSTDTDLTIRRLLVLLIYLVGILGTVRHLSTRQLLDSAVVISLTFITLGLTAEVIQGSFAPLLSTYRFSGTMHPNSQGAICAMLVLSAYCGMRQTGTNRWIYIAAFVIGVIFLYLTKSRSNLFGCAIALYLTSFWQTSFRTKQLLVLIPVLFICSAVLVASFANPDLLGELDVLINIGRDLNTYDIISLHGRVPLWILLKDYIIQKPLLGYGYHGFWTAEIITFFDVNALTWAESGHSVIIDLLLQVGFIGGLLYGLSVATVTYWVVRDCATKGKPAQFFTFALIVYAIFFGLLESTYLSPQSLGAFITSVALFNCCIIKERKNPQLNYPNPGHQ